MQIYLPSSDFSSELTRIPVAVLPMRLPKRRGSRIVDLLAMKYQTVTGLGVPAKSQLNSTCWPTILVLFEGSTVATGLAIQSIDK